VQELLEAHGVSVHGGDELERFEGSALTGTPYGAQAGGRVAKVVTRKGLELEAEAVVIGAGVSPDIQLAQKAGLEIGERGGVRCSSRLESTVPGVFAAGDICEYDSPMHGGHVRIEHWDVAFNHGKTAALNMLGRDVAHETVPYFYSVLGDWGELEYVGPAYGWEEEILRGSFAEGSFTNWYLKDGRVKAALTFGKSDDLDHARRLIAGTGALDERQRGALADVDSDLDDVR
jgi:3-phenylpropionate/trans-cinnamate dioxygenase ferredoxin reductase subunit